MGGERAATSGLRPRPQPGTFSRASNTVPPADLRGAPERWEEGQLASWGWSDSVFTSVERGVGSPNVGVLVPCPWISTFTRNQVSGCRCLPGEQANRPSRVCPKSAVQYLHVRPCGYLWAPEPRGLRDRTSKATLGWVMPSCSQEPALSKPVSFCWTLCWSVSCSGPFLASTHWGFSWRFQLVPQRAGGELHVPRPLLPNQPPVPSLLPPSFRVLPCLPDVTPRVGG